MLASPINQRILEDPADTGGVWAQRRLGVVGQLPRDLAQVLQHTGPRPVQVGTVLENDVHVRITVVSG